MLDKLAGWHVPDDRDVKDFPIWPETKEQDGREWGMMGCIAVSLHDHMLITMTPGKWGYRIQICPYRGEPQHLPGKIAMMILDDE
jgi:hypothetical protein